MDEAAIQCGFCTPGFLMTATEILESGKEYSDEELPEASLWASLPVYGL